MEPHRSVWLLHGGHYAPGSEQVAHQAAASCPAPMGLLMPCSISAVLWFHLDLQLLRRRMAFYGSYLTGRLNDGRLHFCSPPLGGEQGKNKLINKLSPAAYLHLGYGAASVSMAASRGSLRPGKRTSSAPGSCQLPRPDGTPHALFNQCRLVVLS
ncbi:hypothetical protein Tco_0854445 [Tanacetum coccineum]